MLPIVTFVFNFVKINFTEKDIIMNIGEKIKKLRQEKDVSQAVLGEIVGVHEKHISRYERGISRPSSEVLRKMAEFFGVSMNFLVGEDDFYSENPDDNELLDYFEEANQLEDEDKNIIKGVLDAIIFKAKMKRLKNKN
jgi:transcriptional regulator with XRE-family HTH domain